MVDIKKEAVAAILARLPENAKPVDALEMLFHRNLIDKKKMSHALIRKYYFEFRGANEDLTIKDAKDATAVHFDCSLRMVEDAIYYYKLEI